MIIFIIKEINICILVGSESNSDSSEASDRIRFIQKGSFSLKKRTTTSGLSSDIHNTHNLNIQLNSPDLFSIKPNSYGVMHDDESSLDVSSPRDNNSPMVIILFIFSKL